MKNKRLELIVRIDDKEIALVDLPLHYVFTKPTVLDECLRTFGAETKRVLRNVKLTLSVNGEEVEIEGPVV